MTRDDLKKRFLESSELFRRMAEERCQVLAAIGEALVEVQSGGGTLFLFGNGGSASDCQHIAAEFVGRYYGLDRPAMRAVALSTDTSKLTSISNDYGFEQVFARQLSAFVTEKDAALGISTSGGSLNVVRALELAKERGAVTVALTGEDPAACGEIARFVVAVPSSDVPRIQESHIAVGHLLAEWVEAALYRQ